MNAKTAGVYLRAEPGEAAILDGRDAHQRSQLIADRLQHWQEIKSG